MARRYGDLSHFRLGNIPVYFASHPDLVREVLITQRASFALSPMRLKLAHVLGQGLLTSQGDLHARQKRLLTPVFRKGSIAAHAATIVRHSARLRDRLRDGDEVALDAEMMNLTVLIAALAFFDDDIAPNAASFSGNLEFLAGKFTWITSPFSRIYLALPLPATRRFRRAVRELDAVFADMIARRRGSRSGGDLLSLLMQATDDETNVHMTERQLRDEVLTLLIAGHETTANLLTWTLYLVAGDPEVDRRIHDEVRAVLSGRAGLGAEDADRLAYTRCVIQEGLRLYPPGWFVGRQAKADVQLGGYRVPAGSMVMLSQYVVQRDPRFYDDPERFKPERWEGDLLERLPRGAYFPFSAGDRHCIGEGFAWQEAVLVVATLLERWRFCRIPGQEVGTRPSVTLRPDRAVRMTVRERSR